MTKVSNYLILSGRLLTWNDAVARTLFSLDDMDEDFFGSKPDRLSVADDIDRFAKAISQRTVPNPAMSPKALATTTTRSASSSASLIPASNFASVEPLALDSLIQSPSVLIIDIRPHAAYSSARVPNALSLSVPSTLLKRPLFSLDRLAAMLPSSASRYRFSEWPKFSTIVIYDVDSLGSPHLPDGNNILGLLRKFANDSAYSGSNLKWLKGGFQRVWRERRDLVDLRPPEPDAEDDVNESTSLKTNQLPSSAFGGGTTTRNSQAAPSPQRKPPSSTSLRANAPRMPDKPDISTSVPFNPFFDTIRQNLELSHGITERIPLRLPKRVRRRINDLPFEWLREISRCADVKQQDTLSSDGDSSPSSLQPSPSKQNPTPPPPNKVMLDEGMAALAMQFYRIELAEQKRLMGVMKYHSEESGVINSLQRDQEVIAEASAELGSRSISSPDNPALRVSAANTLEPASSTVLNNASDSSSSQSPHFPFLYQQARLRPASIPSNLETSSNFSESDSDRGKTYSSSKREKSAFPFSITAGVEKGAKNRYRHIWPFEHARVRLHQRRNSPPGSGLDPVSAPLPSLELPSISGTPTARLPSGALTGPITSFSGSVPRSSSSAKSPRPTSRLKSRSGIKPSFGTGGLNIVPSPTFNYNSSAFTAPAIKGIRPSAIVGSALKPSFTNMRAPAPPAGSGGETTESEYEHDDSEREVSGREEGKHSPEYDDYVNASYVQPLCTSRRYIATQGPLEATFADFWTLVYQQNVHVIVMLTREIEGSMVKCGPYWKDEVFGALRLKLISTEGNADEGKDDDLRRKDAAGGFFFPAPEPKGEKKKDVGDAIIKRTFLLSHTGYPNIPERKVVQFQYLEWPDMNVPDDPRGVLNLIRQVDQAVAEANHLSERGGEEDGADSWKKNSSDFDLTVPVIAKPSQYRSTSDESLNRYTGIAKQAMGRNQSPVLLHCSAGVGRTGGFIAVDAVLDGIRRELRKKRKPGSQPVTRGSTPADAMDVDREVKVVDDGQGNWDQLRIMNAKTVVEGHTIAIPANNSGDVLHIPIHRRTMVRNSYFPFRLEEDAESDYGLSTPTLSLDPQDTSANSLNMRTPMQVDDYFSSAISSTKRDKAGQETQESTNSSYPRQPSTTRMWAEDVSDQTGSHGTAVRVDEARRQMLSEHRLSEWDATSGKGSEKDQLQFSHRLPLMNQDTVISAAPNRSILPSATSGLSFSSIDSAPSSEDSYGFQNALHIRNRWQLGHQGTQSLTYGENTLTSSTGTSLSPLPSLSAKPGPVSSDLQPAEANLFPAIRIRSEESRARTLSAPSIRVPEAVLKAHYLERKTLPIDKTASSSVPWLSRDTAPSPFLHNRAESVSLPPPSRSLSPSIAVNISEASGIGSERSSVAPGASAARWNAPPYSQLSVSIAPGISPVSENARRAGDSIPASNNAEFGSSHPRTLHSDRSPQSLSKFHEPLMEVLQDMREQRMSLCQSLRQYVFVHAAVIEGSLVVADEERERERKEIGMDVDEDVRGAYSPSTANHSVVSESTPFSSPVQNSSRNHRAGSIISTPSTGKRVASPTELPKEGKKGEQLLFKKPSIKKKSNSTTKQEPWVFRSESTLQVPP
ncbi:hypothetical protein D9757_008927 [Collybiopsis confluens]|uniref:protein-tyrosine-phosphatase n=1 Tax=Collybiopsis confluens TaxID=2823264 RepID=A0A8H5M697_9AGAR|nr:hypothetical protein D9757_008927 [Collybiopsis confluens]